MKLYVPEIGDRLKLTKPWKFKLFYEKRNQSLLEYFGFTFSYRGGKRRDDYEEVTLPKGTVIKVDRIYVRQGAMNFSSISFYAEGLGKSKGSFGKPKSASRFWAKLEECNNVDYEIEEAADRTKPGLWWNVREVKKTGYTYSRRKIKEGPEEVVRNGTIMEKGQSWSDDPLYYVVVKYTEEHELVDKGLVKTIGGIPTGIEYRYKIKRPNMVYIVQDAVGNHIGDFTSWSSMQKTVRQHYKDSI